MLLPTGRRVAVYPVLLSKSFPASPGPGLDCRSSPFRCAQRLLKVIYDLDGNRPLPARSQLTRLFLLLSPPCRKTRSPSSLVLRLVSCPCKSAPLSLTMGPGIGRACAVALSHAGWKVALTARREDQLKEAQKECSGETIVIPGDVTKEDFVEKLFKDTIDKFGEHPLIAVSYPDEPRPAGRLDLLFNVSLFSNAVSNILNVF